MLPDQLIKGGHGVGRVYCEPTLLKCNAGRSDEQFLYGRHAEAGAFVRQISYPEAIAISGLRRREGNSARICWRDWICGHFIFRESPNAAKISNLILTSNCNGLA